MSQIKTKTPNFFILGAVKCGTTSLFSYLSQHPNVFFSAPKEPIFFEAQYEKGLNYYWNQYFSEWKGEKAIGEARHRNLYLPYVPRRIQESVINPRFIVIVRNPINMAYSYWLNMHLSGFDPLPFEDAIYEDIKRIEQGINFENEEGICLWQNSLVEVESNFGKSANSRKYRTYVDSGYYCQQIRRYIKIFSADKIEIVFLEDLAKDSQKVILRLWSFLDLDCNVKLVDSMPKNVSKSLVKGKLINYLKRGHGKTLTYLPNGMKKHTFALLEKLFPKGPSSAMRKDLGLHFLKHNKELEFLTGRDLSHWK